MQIQTWEQNNVKTILFISFSWIVISSALGIDASKLETSRDSNYAFFETFRC